MGVRGVNTDVSGLGMEGVAAAAQPGLVFLDVAAPNGVQRPDDSTNGVGITAYVHSGSTAAVYGLNQATRNRHCRLRQRRHGLPTTSPGASVGTTGTGVYGIATSAAGINAAASSSATAPRVAASLRVASSDQRLDVRHQRRVHSPLGRAVRGNALATTGQTYGVFGYNVSSGGFGVVGQATATSGELQGRMRARDSAGGRARRR